MIILYSGTPGSGKSLHMAKDIYSYLRAGRPVLANFEVKESLIRGPKCDFHYISNDILTPDLLVKFSKIYFKDHKFKEGAIDLYIDEAQLLFNSRDWNRPDRRAWLSFFSQHRKYGYDITLVAQFDKMLDRQVRSLIEYEYIHRKIANFGKFGFFLDFFLPVSPFVAVKVWYPMREKLESSFFFGSRKLYSFYNSFITF